MKFGFRVYSHGFAWGLYQLIEKFNRGSIPGKMQNWEKNTFLTNNLTK